VGRPVDDLRDTGTELHDERSTLLEYLGAYRHTLAMKCAVLEPAVVAEEWSEWHEAVAFAERLVDETADLSTPGRRRDGGEIQLREVLVPMIEEYARHCGHADLLRERIDGRVGQ
jgi:Protein of unknown function (DUF664)